MNQKKCPKCGENNPVEAVMCWACYTPLSASAAAGASTVAGGPPAGAASRGGDENKKAIAPWQIGVIAAALLALGGTGFMVMSGSSAPEQYGTGGDIVVEGPRGGAFPPVGGGGVTTAVPPLSSPAGQQTQQQPVSPYIVTTSPNPNSAVGTVGIVPKQAVDARGAAALAAGMSQRLGGKWKNLHIYVFADSQSARSFNSVVRRNGGRPLNGQDYQQLSGIWAQTLARVVIADGRRSVDYPQSNPNGWWS
jgi:hypothetical protein